MADSERSKCHVIIHSTATLAGGVGAGLAQLPTSDNALLIPLQVGMIISLGAVFSIELTESAARATLATTSVGLLFFEERGIECLKRITDIAHKALVICPM